MEENCGRWHSRYTKSGRDLSTGPSMFTNSGNGPSPGAQHIYKGLQLHAHLDAAAYMHVQSEMPLENGCLLKRAHVLVPGFGWRLLLQDLLSEHPGVSTDGESGKVLHVVAKDEPGYQNVRIRSSMLSVPTDLFRSPMETT